MIEIQSVLASFFDKPNSLTRYEDAKEWSSFEFSERRDDDMLLKDSNETPRFEFNRFKLPEQSKIEIIL